MSIFTSGRGFGFTKINSIIKLKKNTKEEDDCDEKLE
jgi:hypothetical protein